MVRRVLGINTERNSGCAHSWAAWRRWLRVIPRHIFVKDYLVRKFGCGATVELGRQDLASLPPLSSLGGQVEGESWVFQEWYSAQFQCPSVQSCTGPSRTRVTAFACRPSASSSWW